MPSCDFYMIFAKKSTKMKEKWRKKIRQKMSLIWPNSRQNINFLFKKMVLILVRFEEKIRYGIKITNI